MQKDVKIGMLLGLILVAAAGVWLATRPSLSTKARMLRSARVGFRQETSIAPADAQQKIVPQVTSHEPRTTKFHIVRKGQTLSDISYRYYGSANKWKKIFDANRKTIKDANKLTPSTKLIIPE